LDSDQAGAHAVDVRLRTAAACELGDAVEVPGAEPGWRVFERSEQVLPALRAVRTFLADGACVTYTYDFDRGVSATAAIPLDVALAFQPRAELVAEVSERTGLVLCGVDAPPCPGGQG
jgi:hypothetical protein